MKKGIWLLIATGALSLTSCTKQQDYTCQCYGGFTGGPMETIPVKSPDRAHAELQCAALADPPTNTRNSCSLQQR